MTKTASLLTWYVGHTQDHKRTKARMIYVRLRHLRQDSRGVRGNNDLLPRYPGEVVGRLPRGLGCLGSTSVMASVASCCFEAGARLPRLPGWGMIWVDGAGRFRECIL